MTDPMELADWLDGAHPDLAQNNEQARMFTEAAACIREMVERLDRWEPKVSAPSVSCGMAGILPKQAADPSRRLTPLPPAPGAEA